MKSDKKLILMLAFAFFVAGGMIFISLSNGNANVEYEVPSPEEVVKQYFNAWSSKNYPDMYATISDGFKKIELTAADLRAFKSYAESQGVENANIISIEEKSNDGHTSIVDYSLEFSLSNEKKSRLNGTFTLKYRKGDIIPGWKIIHPYGEKADAS